MGKGVAKFSVWDRNDAWILPYPLLFCEKGEKTLSKCLVHMHALGIFVLVGLPCLADDGIGYSGAVMVVRWRVHWICRGRCVEVGRITGVVLPHVMWDYQEEPVEFKVVGDM